MEKVPEGSIYVLSHQQGLPEQKRAIVCYGRIHMQDLLEFEEEGNDVRVYYLNGKVRHFSKNTIFKDEIMPEIEYDSYNEAISNIGDYQGRHIIRVLEIARVN